MRMGRACPRFNLVGEQDRAAGECRQCCRALAGPKPAARTRRPVRHLLLLRPLPFLDEVLCAWRAAPSPSAAAPPQRTQQSQSVHLSQW